MSNELTDKILKFLNSLKMGKIYFYNCSLGDKFVITNVEGTEEFQGMLLKAVRPDKVD